MAIIYEDQFTTGPLSSPRTCEPGPGTLTLFGTSDKLAITGGELTYTNNTASTDIEGGNLGAVTPASGVGMMIDVTLDEVDDVGFTFGFADSTGNPSDASMAAAVQASVAGGSLGGIPGPVLTCNLNGTFEPCLQPALEAGVTYRIAVWQDADGTWAAIQGHDGVCSVGSDYWCVFWKNTSTSWNGGSDVYPFVRAFRANSQTTTFDNLKVVDDFSTYIDKSALIDFQVGGGYGIHIPCMIAHNGMLVKAWQNGSTHLSEDLTIEAEVELADGTRNRQQIFGSLGGGNSRRMGSLEYWGSDLKLITVHGPDGSDAGSVLHECTLTIDSSGNITAGTQSSWSPSTRMSFTPAVTHPTTGRILKSAHSSSGPTSYLRYSDDDGSTWSEVAVPTVSGKQYVEAPIGVEPDGTYVMYFRENGGGNMGRAVITNPDTGTPSVSTPTETTLWNPSSRPFLYNDPAGNLYLASHNVASGTERREVTIWDVGNGASLSGASLVLDFGAIPHNYIWLQYPAIYGYQGQLRMLVSYDSTHGNAKGNGMLEFAELGAIEGTTVPVFAHHYRQLATV